VAVKTPGKGDDKDETSAYAEKATADRKAEVKVEIEPYFMEKLFHWRKLAKDGQTARCLDNRQEDFTEK